MRRSLPLAVLAVALAAPALAQDPFTEVPTTLPQSVSYRSAAPADYDGDGDLDLLVIRANGSLVTATTNTPELYRNDGVGTDGVFTFTEVPFPAPSYPAAIQGGDPYGETLSWADYDNDGDVDALVATHAGTALYRNDEGTFVDAGLLLPKYEEFITWYFADPRSSAWGDVDNDGDPDLALPATTPGGPWPSPDTTRLVLYTNEDGALTRGATMLPRVRRDADLTWGDYDGDEDLDLLYLSGGCAPNELEPDPPECVVIYENDGGALVPRTLDFPQLLGGAADFGDFDLDGDLDVLLVASIHNPDGPPFLLDRAIVYRNDGATFAADTLAFPFSFDEMFQWLTAGRWADYDSDGDVDILVGANVNDYSGPGTDFGGIAFVFANDGGAFTLTAALPAAESFGTETWADFDGDGDLDFLATGTRTDTLTVPPSPVHFAWLYRNEAVGENRPPNAPGALHAEPTEDGTVALSWGPAADDHTAADALTYNLWVRPVAGSDIVSPLARPGGTRLLPEAGNVSLNTQWALQGLAAGTYHWTVQAIDNAFNGGPFSPEGTFTVGATTAGEGAPVPAALTLRGASPNPAAETAALGFDLPAAAEVGARVYDALGREVLTVAPQAYEAGAGRQLVLAVRALPAGTYLVRLEARRGDAVERRTARLTVAR